MATLANVGIATPTNEPPLVEAGLDQTVDRGTRVALDGSGTRDPDGRIVSYRWEIETPSGRTITPTNENTARTSFTPSRLGRYEVTLVAVDDEDVRRSDTLFVDVTRGDEPSVTVSGSNRASTGTTVTYRAEVRRGSAPLRELVWRVDGEVVAKDDLDDDAADPLTTTFATSGRHEIVATVTDVDNLSASDGNSVDVSDGSNPADGGGTSDSDDGSSGGGTSTSFATRLDPSVEGPKLLTGRAPFDASYRVTGVDERETRSVRWYTDRTAGPRGSRAEIDWQPGDHRLYAVVRYTDGSRDVATFRDGSTDVTVDSAPTASIPSVDGWNGLSGRGLARDEYGNLRSFEIEVDGRTVERWPDRTIGSRGRQVSERAARFAVSDARVNRNHTVTVVAVDARGQRDEITREVAVSGQPEIVSAEFVNGPVDSYHERIDPERYAAKHVLKIDLNGVPKEKVDWYYSPGEADSLAQISTEKYGTSTHYNSNTDILIVNSHWRSDIENRHLLDSRVEVDGRSRISNWEPSKIVVTNSAPELRIDIKPVSYLYPATAWDVVVDASRSFDPDGDDLQYIWKQGAQPASADNTTGRFSAIRFATISLRDGEGHVTRKKFDYLRYVTPPVKMVKLVDQGPYRSNESIKIRVRTADYNLGKNSYSIDLGVGVRNTQSKTIEWRSHRGPVDGERWVHYWTGTIEIPASAYLDSETEEVYVYNEERPEDRTDGRSIPAVTVLNHVSPRYSDIGVDEIRYQVRKPVFNQVRVRSAEKRDRYLHDGYDVESKLTEQQYVAKDRVKVADARYEQRRKDFATSGVRRVFLRTNPEWSAGGSTVETTSKTIRETEWRDNKAGKGEFSGETRRVLASPARYRTKKKYRYTREIEHTGHRTVTYWDTVTRQETYTRRVRKCLSVGCYYTTKTFTRTYTDRVQRSYEDTYTYTTTETETYWAFSDYGAGHEFTGKTRRVKIADAQYETQYRFEVERTVQRTVRTYHATRQIKTQPAEYEWRVIRVFDSVLDAYSAYPKGSKRIESRKVVNSWTMTKRKGMSKEILNEYDDESNVVETRATLTGTRTLGGFDSESANYRVLSQSSFEKSVAQSGARNRQELRNALSDNSGRSCKVVRASYKQECSINA
ncbi:PKD domain-containing protein [Halobium palmae]|uniref:PKD domain-containing protein n=1 Tax=Halobium palmae TaxID=1776492 RepID=A0ABD5RYR2_9EURY